MALIRENIIVLESNIYQINSLLKELNMAIDSINSSLANDSNYQIFAQGTDIGKELNEKLQKVITLQKSLNEGTIQDIITKCYNFITIQKELNGGGE